MELNESALANVRRNDAAERQSLNKEIANFLSTITPQPDAPKRTLEEAFSVIRLTRKIMALVNRKPASQKDYRKKGVRLLPFLASGQVPRTSLSGARNELCEALKNSSKCSNSFYANRAGIKATIEADMAKLLAEQDALQRQEKSDAWWQAIETLRNLMTWHSAVSSVGLGALRTQFDIRPQTSQSKRKHLALIEKAQPGWLRLILTRAEHTPYRWSVFLSWLLGVRPVELERMSVQLTLEGPLVRAHIFGSKLSASAGQPSRSLQFDLNLLPAHMQTELVAHIRLVSVFLPPYIKGSVVARFLLRATRSCLPAGLPAVTSYVFRHHLVSTLREAGWTVEEIAEAIGHSVSETQRYYGSYRRPRSGGPAMNTTIIRGSVVVERKVRPMSRNFLTDGRVHVPPGSQVPPQRSRSAVRP